VNVKTFLRTVSPRWVREARATIAGSNHRGPLEPHPSSSRIVGVASGAGLAKGQGRRRRHLRAGSGPARRMPRQHARAQDDSSQYAPAHTSPLSSRSCSRVSSHRVLTPAGV
jgi:hypothetical protein